MGPQISGWLRGMPTLDFSVWVVLVVAYIYFFATLVKLRRRLRYRDAGVHEKVAAV